MAVIKAVSGGASTIRGIITYLTKEGKSEDKLMTGIRCSSVNALEEMTSTKSFYQKMDGRQYKHFIQSFSPEDDITPETAHAIALRLVRTQTMFEGFECLVVTHIDRQHLHSHVVVNSVSLEDGHKFRYSKRDLEALKNGSDSICNEYGLSTIDRSKPEIERKIDNPVSFNQYTHTVLTEADKGNADSWVYSIAERVLDAKTKASDKDSFIRILGDFGVYVDWKEERKHLVFIIKEEDGTRKKVRGNTLEKYFHIGFDKESLENEFGEKNNRKERNERIMHGADLGLSEYSARYAASHRSTYWTTKSLDCRKGRSR